MSTIGSLLSSFWEKIREGFTFLIQSIVDGLQWLFDTAVSLLTEFYNYIRVEVFSPLYESVVTNPFGNVSFLDSVYLSWVNYFLPVSEVLHILTVLLGVWFAVLSLKIIVKLIPTIY